MSSGGSEAHRTLYDGKEEKRGRRAALAEDDEEEDAGTRQKGLHKLEEDAERAKLLDVTEESTGLRVRNQVRLERRGDERAALPTVRIEYLATRR